MKQTLKIMAVSAFATAAPEGSMTVPLNDALPIWACAGIAIKSTPKHNAIKQPKLKFTELCRLRHIYHLAVGLPRKVPEKLNSRKAPTPRDASAT